MGIFLRQSYNVKPLRWGSAQDIEYAVKVNAEKVYGVDPDSIVLAMPLFFGLPCLDYSGKRNDGVNNNEAYYKDGELEFVAADYNYIDCGNDVSLNILSGDYFTISLRIKPNTLISFDGILSKKHSDIDGGYSIWTYSDTEYFRICSKSWGLPDLLTVGKWQYITFVGNKAIGVTIFKNGVSQTLTVDQGDYTGLGDNVNKNLLIGRAQGRGYFDGSIDEVRIANVARTADQIALFHALPYGLYQPVIRRYYSIPMPPYVFTKNLSDTINLTDVISSKNIGLNKTDTISLSDSIVKKPGLNKTDTISLSDDISSKSFGLNKADTISITDNIIKIFGLNKNDTITLSDLMIKNFGLNKADTIILSDSITKAFGFSLSDTINLSDSILSKNIGALLNFIAKKAGG